LPSSALLLPRVQLIRRFMVEEIRLRVRVPLVRDVMKANPVTATTRATVKEVVDLMASHRIGSVVIVDPATPCRPVGIVTEKDVVRWVSEGRPLGEPVEKIMSRGLVTVKEVDTIFDAARLMKQHGIRHLVVVDEDGCLRGVFSERDIVAHLDLIAELARQV